MEEKVGTQEVSVAAAAEAGDAAEQVNDSRSGASSDVATQVPDHVPAQHRVLVDVDRNHFRESATVLNLGCSHDELLDTANAEAASALESRNKRHGDKLLANESMKNEKELLPSQLQLQRHSDLMEMRSLLMRQIMHVRAELRRKQAFSEADSDHGAVPSWIRLFAHGYNALHLRRRILL
eukprot:SAG31_NODE_21825_length_540_cov_0.587302_1_plen_179_part_11